MPTGILSTGLQVDSSKWMMPPIEWYQTDRTRVLGAEEVGKTLFGQNLEIQIGTILTVGLHRSARSLNHFELI